MKKENLKEVKVLSWGEFREMSPKGSSAEYRDHVSETILSLNPESPNFAEQKQAIAKKLFARVGTRPEYAKMIAKAQSMGMANWDDKMSPAEYAKTATALIKEADDECEKNCEVLKHVKEQVNGMVAQLTNEDKKELLAKHGDGGTLEQKYITLSQHLASKQKNNQQNAPKQAQKQETEMGMSI